MSAIYVISFLASFHCLYVFRYLVLQIYFTYYLYYLSLYCSLDFCSLYCDYFAALTQILCLLCNTDESGGSRRFTSPAETQDQTTALLIWSPLLPVSLPHPNPVPPICSARSVYPIRPLASQFIPFCQQAHKSQFI